MYRLSIDFHNRLMRGEIPISYAVIETHLGWRIYAEKELSELYSYDTIYLADGSSLADGSITAGSGSLGEVEKSARVLSFGSFERALQPLKSDVLESYHSKTLQHMSLQLDNADRYFSKLMPKEPFIGRPLQYFVGFEATPFSNHLNIFRGVITEIHPMPVMTIEADEQ